MAPAASVCLSGRFQIANLKGDIFPGYHYYYNYYR
jgi:hypothetical protein